MPKIIPSRSTTPTPLTRLAAAFGCALALGSISGTLALGAPEPTRLNAPAEGMVLKMVTNDKTPLRSGDQDAFYAIAELDANTPVQAGGVSGDYTMILLPDSIGAFVPVGEVESVPSGASHTVVIEPPQSFSGEVGSGLVDRRATRIEVIPLALSLVVDSKLRAPSQLLGIAGSWKALYNEPLPAGTTLTIIKMLKSDSGDILGYRVVAPKSPSGELPIAYIKTSALRDPTADELREQATPGTASTPEPAAKPVVEPVDEPADEPVAKPAGEEQGETAEMLDLVPATKISDDQASEPVEIKNRTPRAIEPDKSGTQTPAQKIASNGHISTAQLEDLEAVFDQARGLKRAELDEALDELHAEFTRTRAQAEAGSSLARSLDQRLEWIAIRIESRDQRRAIAATLAANDERLEQLNSDISAWQAGRAYLLVGRMVTSSVYTGEHLPLLYRIRTVDPATGASQTIGYVAPRADQDFRDLLGRIVGVVGSSTADQSLMLSVIEPDRIDPMPEE